MPLLRKRPLLGLVAVTSAAACIAGTPALGHRAIATVFFVNKSDDRNRVDYAINLDRHCVPRPDAMFPYWHEFEPKERTHPLGAFEDSVYGVENQHLVTRSSHGAVYVVKLKRFDRAITITTFRKPDGSCGSSARTRIAGVADAELLSAFARIGALLSIDYIELRGRDPRTGARLTERIRP